MNTIFLYHNPKWGKSRGSVEILERFNVKYQIIEYLKKITKGTGNELQLTDAISLCAKNENAFSYRFSGTRYDCGSKLGYLKAQLASGLLDSDIRNSVKKELQNFIKKGIN